MHQCIMTPAMEVTQSFFTHLLIIETVIKKCWGYIIPAHRTSRSNLAILSRCRMRMSLFQTVSFQTVSFQTFQTFLFQTCPLPFFVHKLHASMLICSDTTTNLITWIRTCSTIRSNSALSYTHFGMANLYFLLDDI